jgi:2-oxoglutarate ferredoxin oxidoreductase subunit alpha
METVGDERVAFLYFKQVYPIHPDTAKYLDMAESLIIIENNMTGQFGKLITLNFGHEMDEAFLKYNGLPFSVEELVQNIETIL